jgi:hypothetical protein
MITPSVKYWLIITSPVNCIVFRAKRLTALEKMDRILLIEYCFSGAYPPDGKA